MAIYVHQYNLCTYIIIVVIRSDLLGNFFSLGLQPYPSVDPSEMSSYLKSRKVLDKPSLSSDEM